VLGSISYVPLDHTKASQQLQSISCLPSIIIVSSTPSASSIMASEPEKIHRQLISIKDLPTRSVTIYPSRAAVVRDIENIDIKVLLLIPFQFRVLTLPLDWLQ